MLFNIEKGWEVFVIKSMFVLRERFIEYFFFIQEFKYREIKCIYDYL